MYEKVGTDFKGHIFNGNEFEIELSKEFEKGKVENLCLANVNGKNSIVIKKENDGYLNEGVYVSHEIDVSNFEYMICSWNGFTPKETYIEVQGRVLVNHFNKDDEKVQTWSEWLSWGKWSPYIERASVNTECDVACISTDELRVNGDRGETASRIQIKVILHSDNKDVTPSLRYIHGSLKNTIDEETLKKVFDEEIDLSNAIKDIDTPAYSQIALKLEISNSICSPTTISMLMNRLGESLLPEEVAHKIYDYNYGFGNWAFAMAFSGECGYKAYVDYTTIEGLKREIIKGYPVGVSVRYSNEIEGKYPYVEGAPGNTPGHLMVVRGFEEIEGIEYVIVNDPYGSEDINVRRKYKLEHFKKAWSNGVAYIIHK